MFQLLTFDFLLSNLQPYYIVNSFSSFDADGHAHDDLQVRRFKVPDSSASSSVAALIKLSFIASTSWLTLRIFKAFSSNSNARASRFRLHSAYFLLCFKFILPAPFSPSFFECLIFPILQFLGFSVSRSGNVRTHAQVPAYVQHEVSRSGNVSAHAQVPAYVRPEVSRSGNVSAHTKVRPDKQRPYIFRN